MLEKTLIAFALSAVLVLTGSFLYMSDRPRPEPHVEDARPLVSTPPTAKRPAQGPLAARRAAWVRGVVLDGYGVPVTDAVATLRLEPAEAAGGDPAESGEKVIEVISGEFAVGAPEGARCTVSVESASWGRVALGPFEVEQDLDLELSFECSASITGFFFGDGEAVKRFEEDPRMIFVEGPLGIPQTAPVRVPVSFSEGSLAFQFHPLGPGSFRIVGNYGGYPFEQAFEVPRNEGEYEVAIEIGETEERLFVGRALSARTGEPIPHATLTGHVHAFGTSTNLPGAIETDGEGYFQFASAKLRRGMRVVLSHDRDYPEAEVRFGDVDDEGIHRVVFPDPPRRVALALDRFGEVISFAGLYLVPEDDDSAIARQYRRYVKKAGDDGEFSITDVPPGSYRGILVLDTGTVDLPEPVEISPDPAVDVVAIETGIDRILYITAVSPDGAPACFYSAYARVYQNASSPPALVSLNPLPSLLLPPGPIDGRVGLGLRDVERLELFVISPELGFTHLELGSAWLERNGHVVARFGDPPEHVDVRVVTQNGRPLDDATFEIPIVTDAAVRSQKADRGSWETVANPFLEVRKRSPGVFRLRCYPGEGSRVEVSAPDHATVTIDTRVLLEERKVVMPR